MLTKNDFIITAFAESYSGPGWSNSVIIVIVKSKLDGKIREEFIQPDYQTDEMITLFDLSRAAHYAMTKAAKST